MFTTTNAARLFSPLYRMGGQGGWYIPQLPGRPLSAGGCIIFRSLALIMPKQPTLPRVYVVYETRTHRHIACVSVARRVLQSCRMLTLFTHTSISRWYNGYIFPWTPVYADARRKQRYTLLRYVSEICERICIYASICDSLLQKGAMSKTN